MVTGGVSTGIMSREHGWKTILFRPRSVVIEWLLNFLVAGAMAAMICHFGDIQFGGMDAGVLSKIGWMALLGYRAYVDYVLPVPPIYILLSKWSFELYGVYWHSLVQITALYCVATFLFHLFILRRMRIQYPWAMLIAVAVQTTAILPLSWPHYNQVTSVAAALYLTTCIAAVWRKPDSVDVGAMAIALALLLLCKLNVALPSIFLSAPILLSICDRRAALLKAWLAGLLLVGLILWVEQISPATMLVQFFGAGHRVLSWDRAAVHLGFRDMSYYRTEELICVSPVFIIVAAAIDLCIRRSPASLNWPWQATAMAVVGVVVTLLGIATNFEFHLTDFPAAITTVGLVACQDSMRSGIKIGWYRQLLFILSVLGMIYVALFTMVQRARVQSIGDRRFFENFAPYTLQDPPFFRGVRCGQILRRTLAEMQDALKAYGVTRDSNTSVYFGPRLEFGYATFNLLPPKGLPIWWPGFNEESPSVIQAQVMKFKSERIAVCVLLRYDFTFFPDSLKDCLENDYDAHNTPMLTVYTLKQMNRASVAIVSLAAPNDR